MTGIVYCTFFVVMSTSAYIARFPPSNQPAQGNLTVGNFNSVQVPVYQSGDLLSFIIPVQASIIRGTLLTGKAIQIGPTTGGNSSIQPIYGPTGSNGTALGTGQIGFSPKSGYFGLFVNCRLNRALTNNTIEEITLVNLITSYISTTMHGSDFIGKANGLGVFPMFKDCSYDSARAGTQNVAWPTANTGWPSIAVANAIQNTSYGAAMHSFAYTLPLGVLNAGHVINLEVSGGLQIDMFIARFVDNSNQLLPFGAVAPAFPTSLFCPATNSYSPNMNSSGIQVYDPVLWVIMDLAPPSPADDTFPFHFISVRRAQTQQGTNTFLSVFLLDSVIQSFYYLMLDKTHLVAPQFPTYLSSAYSLAEFKFLIGGNPQLYAYPAWNQPRDEQFSQYIPNALIQTALSTDARTQTLTNVFNGGYVAYDFDPQGNGTTFANVIAQYQFFFQPVSTSSYPFNSVTINNGAPPIMSTGPIFQQINTSLLQDTVDYDATPVSVSSSLVYQAACVTAAYFYPLTEAANAEKQLPGLGQIINPYVKYGDYKSATTDFDVLAVTTETKTVIINQAASSILPVAPVAIPTPDVLKFNNAAPRSGVVRVENRLIVAQVMPAPSTIKNAIWLQVLLPSNGMPGDMFLNLRIRWANDSPGYNGLWRYGYDTVYMGQIDTQIAQNAGKSAFQLNAGAMNIFPVSFVLRGVGMNPIQNVSINGIPVMYGIPSAVGTVSAAWLINVSNYAINYSSIVPGGTTNIWNLLQGASTTVSGGTGKLPFYFSSSIWNTISLGSQLGSAGLIRRIDWVLPNSVNATFQYVQEDHFLQTYGLDKQRTISQSKYDGNFTDGWIHDSQFEGELVDCIQSRQQNRCFGRWTSLFPVWNTLSQQQGDYYSRLSDYQWNVPPILRINLSAVHSSFVSMQRVPNTAIQQRFLNIYLDTRCLSFANVCSGIGYGLTHEADVARFLVGPQPEACYLTPYPASAAGTFAAARGFPRKHVFNWVLDPTWTPTVTAQLIYYAPATMERITSDFATKGHTMTFTLFDYQRRYAQYGDFEGWQNTNNNTFNQIVTDNQLQIGGRNPQLLMITHKPLMNVNGDMALVNQPLVRESYIQGTTTIEDITDITRFNWCTELLAIPDYLASRDGAISCSLPYVVENPTDLSFNQNNRLEVSQYNITVDNVPLQPFYFGSNAVNALMYSYSFQRPTSGLPFYTELYAPRRVKLYEEIFDNFLGDLYFACNNGPFGLTYSGSPYLASRYSLTHPLNIYAGSGGPLYNCYSRRGQPLLPTRFVTCVPLPSDFANGYIMKIQDVSTSNISTSNILPTSNYVFGSMSYVGTTFNPTSNYNMSVTNTAFINSNYIVNAIQCPRNLVREYCFAQRYVVWTSATTAQTHYDFPAGGTRYG